MEKAKPATPESWVADAGEFEAKRDCAKALAVLDKGLRELDEHPALWDAKGQLFYRFQMTNEALHAFGKSIELAESSTNNFRNVKRQALSNRSNLLLQMGRLSEAGTDNCLARDIPLRDSQTALELIDLSAFYNFPTMATNNEMAKVLASQIRKATGVEFDVRALVRVYGKFVEDMGWGRWPDSVTGIPVNLQCARIYFLHHSDHAELDRTEIGSYLLHFANGRTEEVPIVYGENIRAWAEDYRPTPYAKFVRNGVGASVMKQIANNCFMMAWTNQTPEIEVKSLDFISAKTVASPQLIAVTVDKAHFGQTGFPPQPATQAPLLDSTSSLRKLESVKAPVISQ